MSGRAWALEIAMWVLIVAAVPVYVVWLVRAGYLTGQHRLPGGDVIRRVLPTLVPAAAAVLCILVGHAWWVSVVTRAAAPLRERWTVMVLLIIGGAGVLWRRRRGRSRRVQRAAELRVTGLGMPVSSSSRPPAPPNCPTSSAGVLPSPPPTRERNRAPPRGVGHGVA
ncbi:hypothetical protein ABZ896_13535 [Streptomyces sp. NPDC047072]|uniref:hypothetical protein n=1 Tax=Streptomyces sp. NPDC047072 TaxID=3154809 RepID=UPI003403C027